jgi:hypothetical protein
MADFQSWADHRDPNLKHRKSNCLAPIKTNLRCRGAPGQDDSNNFFIKGYLVVTPRSLA